MAVGVHHGLQIADLGCVDSDSLLDSLGRGFTGAEKAVVQIGIGTPFVTVTAGVKHHCHAEGLAFDIDNPFITVLGDFIFPVTTKFGNGVIGDFVGCFLVHVHGAYPVLFACWRCHLMKI